MLPPECSYFLEERRNSCFFVSKMKVGVQVLLDKEEEAMDNFLIQDFHMLWDSTFNCQQSEILVKNKVVTYPRGIEKQEHLFQAEYDTLWKMDSDDTFFPFFIDRFCYYKGFYCPEIALLLSLDSQRDRFQIFLSWEGREASQEIMSLYLLARFLHGTCKRSHYYEMKRLQDEILNTSRSNWQAERFLLTLYPSGSIDGVSFVSKN